MSHPSASGSRLLPHPLLSALLAASWLLLQQSTSPANLLAALLLAVAVPKLVAPFLGRGARVQRSGRVLRLVARVLCDVVVANLVVARLVLSPSARPQPAWVTVRLALTDPTAISLLAAIITTTPGTVSCIVDDERREILVHALDCRDPAALAADIKQRYENPLREIFR
jgi:multicomponent K+:H+ antiporter subunit E